ncbi:MAG: trigger factor [Hyphomicrobiales bacterium]|nr:trigger factor [Hyphomicrobiales bacterium]MDE2114695.1 trigger factor [Hyphomicrobiales bacterium]
MQVTETLSQGLKRAYKVVLPAGDLAQRLDGQLADMKDKVRINGFRPGKVPVAHLKRLYGKSIMGEVVQNAVNEANRKIVEDNGLRLALEPKVDFPGDQAEVERALEAKGDLAFTINLETLPKFEVGTFEDIAIERPVATLSDEEVDKSVNRLADRNRTYADAPKKAVAAEHDRVTIDFVGKMDDVAFEGGSGTDVDVVLGSGSFIPGFEEQLIGIKAGAEKVVKVRFPENYTALHLAGKEAVFDVTAKKIAHPEKFEINDEFAKGFGFDNVEALRTAIRENLQKDHDKASRDRLKRALLDELDKKYSFELPEGLVEMEFNNVWSQVMQEQATSGKTFEQEGTTEEASKAEYRRIAERRVRLGLVLAEVGEKASVQVNDEEVGKALVERARAYPGQEKMVWEYYTKNEQALAEIRAPLFEEKVIDHIVAQAKVTDKEISRDDLFAPMQD